MKTILSGVLAGVGGIGAIGTTVSIVYPTSGSNEDGINDAIFDAKFAELKEKIKDFAGKCQDKTVQYGTTVLKELKDIFGMLLGPKVKYSDNTKSNLEIRKEFLEKRLTGNERESFKDLYEKMKKFSNSLQNKQQKFDRYKEQLE